jgi:hypothetical protein
LEQFDGRAVVDTEVAGCGSPRLAAGNHGNNALTKINRMRFAHVIHLQLK